VLTELEDKLKRTEMKAEQYDMRSQQNSRVINALKSSIQQLFIKTGCNSAALTEMLGDSAVTEQNMLTYLAAIEQRTNELLLVYKTSKPEEAVNVSHTGPHAPVGGVTVQPLTLPSTGMICA